jgi:predicted Zn finger-like uncharacterized protein
MECRGIMGAVRFSEPSAVLAQPSPKLFRHVREYDYPPGPWCKSLAPGIANLSGMPEYRPLGIVDKKGRGSRPRRSPQCPLRPAGSLRRGGDHCNLHDSSMSRPHSDKPSGPPAEAPTGCPVCRSQSISTTGKSPGDNAYWRCGKCGEVWNASRRDGSVKDVPQPNRRRPHYW